MEFLIIWSFIILHTLPQTVLQVFQKEHKSHRLCCGVSCVSASITFPSIFSQEKKKTKNFKIWFMWGVLVIPLPPSLEHLTKMHMVSEFIYGADSQVDVSEGYWVFLKLEVHLPWASYTQTKVSVKVEAAKWS